MVSENGKLWFPTENQKSMAPKLLLTWQKVPNGVFRLADSNEPKIYIQPEPIGSPGESKKNKQKYFIQVKGIALTRVGRSAGIRSSQ